MDEFNNNNGFGQAPNQPMDNQNQWQQQAYNQTQWQQPINNQNQWQQPNYNQTQWQQSNYNQNTNQNPDYVRVTEGYTENYNNYNNQNSNSNNHKKLIIILSAVVALLVLFAGGVFAAYKCVPGIFLSGEDAFFAMEAKAIENLEKELKEGIVGKYIASLEQPTKSEMKITVNAGTDISQQSKDQIDSLLKDSSVGMKTQTDYKNGYESAEIDLKLMGKDFNFDYQNDNGALAFGLSQLYDKYIIADANNLTPILEKFDVYDGPKKLVSNKELIEILKLTDEEKKYLNKATQEYMELIKKNVNNKNFTKKSEKLTYLDKEVKCNIVEYKFTVEDSYNILKAIMTKLKDDNKTLEIIISRRDKIYNLYLEAGYITEEEMPTIDEVKTQIEEAIVELDSAYNNQEDKNEVGMTIRNYYKNDLTILKREYITLVPDYKKMLETNEVNFDAKKESKLEIYTIDNKDEAYYAFMADENEISINITKGKEKDEYKLVMKEADGSPNDESIEITGTIEKISENEKLIKGALKSQNDEKLVFTFDCNVKEEKTKMAFELKVNISDESEDINMTIGIQGGIENNVTIEKIDVSNSWDIGNATMPEINRELAKIQNNIVQIYMSFVAPMNDSSFVSDADSTSDPTAVGDPVSMVSSMSI